MRAMSDEYVLDTAVVRAFVDDVRETIASASSPEQACEVLRPRFAELLADPNWLPAQYQAAAPESGMGGGIGQWLLYRAEDQSLSLFSLVVPPELGDADPRPPRLGPRRSLPRRAGRGDLRPARGCARARRAALARTRRLLRPDPASRRHPPRAHDLPSDVRLDPPADERHRLRLAPRVRPCLRRGEAVPLWLRQRGLRGRIARRCATAHAVAASNASPSRTHRVAPAERKNASAFWSWTSASARAPASSSERAARRRAHASSATDRVA